MYALQACRLSPRAHGKAKLTCIRSGTLRARQSSCEGVVAKTKPLEEEDDQMQVANNIDSSRWLC